MNRRAILGGEIRNRRNKQTKTHTKL